MPISDTERLRKELDDMTAARRTAAEAADRFRDVVTEVLGLDENPGDDVLVTELRALHDKTGPEPTRWREFLTGAHARLESLGVLGPATRPGAAAFTCSWCPDPASPDPRAHPNEQRSHLPMTASRPNAAEGGEAR